MTIDLLTTHILNESGTSDRAIRSMIEDGRLVRLREGVYVDGKMWQAQRFESRLVVRSRAWAATTERTTITSHASAAAHHRLPLVFTRRETIDLLVPEPRRGRAPGIVRRRWPADRFGTGDVEVSTVELDGVLCTDLETTVVDVGRSERRETAIAVADAALRRVAGPDPRRPDWEAVERMRTRMLDLVATRASFRAKAASVIIAADPRADGPGESVSRDRLAALGADVRGLQPAMPAPGGGWFYPDFELGDDVFGEFDGDGKYVDSELLAGRTTAQVVLDEKRREDWLRMTTDRRFVRWGWPQISTVATFGRFLSEARVALRFWPPRSHRGG